MDFSNPGWFSGYIKYRTSEPLTLRHAALDPKYFSPGEPPSPERALYMTLQETGLLYGFPAFNPAEFSDSLKESIRGRKQISRFIFLETLFVCLLKLDFFEERRELQAELLEQASGSIRSFFLGIMPGFLPGKTENEALEAALSYRMQESHPWWKGRKGSLSSLLFWDIFLLLEFHSRRDQNVHTLEQYLMFAREFLADMKALTLEVIILAAHANDQIEPEEEKLFRESLDAAELNRKENKRLRKQFKLGMDLDEWELPELPWIARRYLLDMALLTLLSNQSLNPSEWKFMEELAERLKLDPEELEESEASLGIFLLTHGSRLPFLRERKDALTLIGLGVRNNVKKLFRALKSESTETKEMATTFGKMLASQLRIRDREDLPSPKEIKAALDQLKDIPRFAPFFAIFFMPVPGITELYLLLAVTLEKMTDGNVQLLPNAFSKALQANPDEEELR